MNTPNYTAYSTDIVSSKITGVNIIGATVFIIDDGTWFVVEDDLTLAPYSIGSVSSTISGALPAGTNSIGSVTAVPYRSLTVQPTVTPVLTVAATYVTGDYVGTSSACMTFNSCSAIAGSGGYILGAELIDAAKQSIAAELWLFDGIPTVPADSAPFDISDSDAAKLVCIIPFSTYYASVSNSISMGAPAAGNARFVCGAAVRELYGALVTRGAPAYTNGCLTVRLSILQD